MTGPEFTKLANALLDAEIDRGGLTGYSDRELDTARQIVAEELTEAWTEALHELRRSEPSACTSGRCGQCDLCVNAADDEYHRRREAA